MDIQLQKLTCMRKDTKTHLYALTQILHTRTQL